MKETNQSIKGSNNIQIVEGNVIQTKKVKIVTEVLHDATTHITDSQALEIREKITEIVNMVSSNKGNKSTLFPKEYSAFYKQFKITKYSLLPKEDFNSAIKWLNKRIAYYGKKNLRHGDNEQWRKKQYIAINARARQLNMNRDDLLLFTTQKLQLKKPLASIKDLSSTRLQKLYNFIMRKK
ncbi:ORF6C domain-containing protein [Tenacibaculum maritimum]|uniref:ORF6C domain-containing protein n=1 Tax=Tenacibaculum maritimum TaxID=107401 RepID=UPI0012E498EE|nr:ORF6C domain-containing protein [Tenacibaculum maritimum]CAA0211340.1 conserved hypothetical protein [Tenacibaculum maritimum]